MSPQQIQGMSLWQFTAFTEGFVAFNSSEKKSDAPSEDEFEAFVQETKRAELIAAEQERDA